MSDYDNDAVETRDLSAWEQEARLRGYGEAGWDYGWDVNVLSNQYAHLGEMVVQLAALRRDPQLAEDYDEPYLETADLYPDGPRSFAEDLERRIAEWAWKLDWLKYHVRDEEAMTSDEFRQLEVAWTEYQATLSK